MNDSEDANRKANRGVAAAVPIKYGRGQNPNSKANLQGPRWLPGESGNPSGGTRSFKERLQKAIRNGDLLVEVLLDVFENGRHADQLDAVKFVADRVYGRAVETQVQIQADAHRLGTRIDLAPEALEALARAILPAPTYTHELEAGPTIEADAPATLDATCETPPAPKGPDLQGNNE